MEQRRNQDEKELASAPANTRDLARPWPGPSKAGSVPHHDTGLILGSYQHLVRNANNAGLSTKLAYSISDKVSLFDAQYLSDAVLT